METNLYGNLTIPIETKYEHLKKKGASSFQLSWVRKKNLIKFLSSAKTRANVNRKCHVYISTFTYKKNSSFCNIP